MASYASSLFKRISSSTSSDSTPAQQPKWWFDLPIGGTTFDDVAKILSLKKAEIAVITGHNLSFCVEQPTMVSVHRDPGAVNNSFIQVSGPLIDIPNIKSIVIAYAHKVCKALKEISVIVFFDPMEERTAEDQPWFHEIMAVQGMQSTPGLNLSKSYSWQFSFDQSADDGHSALKAAIEFVSDRNKTDIVCLVKPNPNVPGSFIAFGEQASAGLHWTLLSTYMTQVHTYMGSLGEPSTQLYAPLTGVGLLEIKDIEFFKVSTLK